MTFPPLQVVAARCLPTLRTATPSIALHRTGVAGGCVLDAYGLTGAARHQAAVAGQAADWVASPGWPRARGDRVHRLRFLPTAEELRAELTRERQDAERALRSAAGEEGP